MIVKFEPRLIKGISHLAIIIICTMPIQLTKSVSQHHISLKAVAYNRILILYYAIVGVIVSNGHRKCNQYVHVWNYEVF